MSRRAWVSAVTAAVVIDGLLGVLAWATPARWLGLALVTVPAVFYGAVWLDRLEARVMLRWRTRLGVAPYDWQQDEAA